MKGFSGDNFDDLHKKMVELQEAARENIAKTITSVEENSKKIPLDLVKSRFATLLAAGSVVRVAAGAVEVLTIPRVAAQFGAGVATVLRLGVGGLGLLGIAAIGAGLVGLVMKHQEKEAAAKAETPAETPAETAAPVTPPAPPSP